MILVTGATGKTGSEVVRQLRARGAAVRALVRDRARGEALLPAGVALAEGDLASPETLDAALLGVERLFLLSPSEPGAVELQVSTIEAAQRAGVRRVVKLSALRAHEASPVGLLRDHRAIEQRLEVSGLPFTIVRPHTFMQNLLAFAATIGGGGKLYGSAGEGRVGFVDVRDIAAVAAAVLTEDGHEGRTYDVTGPQALSYSEVAERLSAAIGCPVTYVDLPPAAFRRGLIGAGVPEWLADNLVALDQTFREDRGDVVTDVVRSVGKAEPRSVDQFAREFAPVFRGEAG